MWHVLIPAGIALFFLLVIAVVLIIYFMYSEPEIKVLTRRYARDGDPGGPGTHGKHGEVGLPGVDGLYETDSDGNIVYDSMGNPILRPIIHGAHGGNGAHGNHGVHGNPGKHGVHGVPGVPGLNGLKGDQGFPGERGTPGVSLNMHLDSIELILDQGGVYTLNEPNLGINNQQFNFVVNKNYSFMLDGVVGLSMGNGRSIPVSILIYHKQGDDYVLIRMTDTFFIEIYGVPANYNQWLAEVSIFPPPNFRARFVFPPYLSEHNIITNRPPIVSTIPDGYQFDYLQPDKLDHGLSTSNPSNYRIMEIEHRAQIMGRTYITGVAPNNSSGQIFTYDYFFQSRGKSGDRFFAHNNGSYVNSPKTYHVGFFIYKDSSPPEFLRVSLPAGNVALLDTFLVTVPAGYIARLYAVIHSSSYVDEYPNDAVFTGFCSGAASSGPGSTSSSVSVSMPVSSSSIINFSYNTAFNFYEFS